MAETGEALEALILEMEGAKEVLKPKTKLVR